MPAFDVDKEEVNAFGFGETYPFTAHFDENQLFNQFKKYYNIDGFRFEVLEEDMKQVQQVLENFFYKPPASILKSSVVRKQRHNREMFVMKDKSSLHQAVEQGATPLEESRLNKGIEMANRLITAGASTSNSGKYKYLAPGFLIRKILL